LGVIATLMAIIGVVPYISLQLKAIVTSFDILAASQNTFNNTQDHLFTDTSFYLDIALAFFTILFGTRHLDPNERHEGLVAAIAFESIIKLSAFLAIGIFVTYGLFNGFKHLFFVAANKPELLKILSLQSTGMDAWQWFWLSLISAFAVLLLPRQFHIAVVENTNPQSVGRASWMFPLYLLLINIFVLPIAIAGLLLLNKGMVEPDNFVLALPLAAGKPILALIAAIGGFSAATSMIIVEVIALSIMISNNLVLPLLLQIPRLQESRLPNWLLLIRRISIIGVVFLAYSYFGLIEKGYSLVSIGLVSFVAVSQFAPSVFGGILWKRATKKGALAGLVIGFLVWSFTSPLPPIKFVAEYTRYWAEFGLGGIEWLKPQALFGFSGLDPITHAAFWSLLLNTFAYIFVSLYSSQTPLEVTQADIFVDIYKHSSGTSEYDVMRRKAKVQDLYGLLVRFLGEERAQHYWQEYETKQNINLSKTVIANTDLVNYTEINLTGAIGAASAKILVGSVSKQDPISLEEMLNVLEQTQEIMQYSQALEKKSEELQNTTKQLKQANQQLQELDRLKADFIATVTHELRTPITSIKALSKILSDNKELPSTQKDEFLGIIVSESERITRLINQVLDLDKIQSNREDVFFEKLNLVKIVEKTYLGLQPLMKEKQIEPSLKINASEAMLWGHADRLTQVITNLLGNAIKFCHGKIWVQLDVQAEQCTLSIQDNGVGIAKKNQNLIFEKFSQVNDADMGKPQGSGLGLFICKTIIEQHGGKITLGSELGYGATFKVQLPLYKTEFSTEKPLPTRNGG
jgi:signal transduction histidine kinase